MTRQGWAVSNLGDYDVGSMTADRLEPTAGNMGPFTATTVSTPGHVTQLLALTLELIPSNTAPGANDDSATTDVDIRGLPTGKRS